MIDYLIFSSWLSGYSLMLGIAFLVDRKAKKYGWGGITLSVVLAILAFLIKRMYFEQ